MLGIDEKDKFNTTKARFCLLVSRIEFNIVTYVGPLITVFNNKIISII